MSDLETHARAESRCRYDGRGSANDLPLRDAFLLGALWAARLEPSDAEVEAAARAIAQTVHTLALSGAEDGTRESALTDYIARTALTAARQAQKEG